MPAVRIDSPPQHKAFLASQRKHILMITNHGIHQWQVIPGLPDTGGQNMFVNQFTASLTSLGFKVTIVNRGGYRHPVTGDWQRGLVYKDAHQRILYLEDGRAEFVRKEDMHEQIPRLVESLQGFLDDAGTNVDLILSHYWDGSQIGVLYNRGRPQPAKHVWVPHSLGTVKKRNVAEDRWGRLRIDERITVEKRMVPELDAIAATSSTIKRALQSDYGYIGPDLFLPPCVDPDHFHPRQVPDEDGIWRFLSQRSGMPLEEIRACKVVTEISRTDTTKRKDVLIKAFAQAHAKVPESLLVVSIDETETELSQELRELISAHNMQAHIAVVGSIWNLLPTLYAISDVYCTPSVMEGFGMSAQEAAATAVPVIASHLVPFAAEYLLGPTAKENGADAGGDQAPLRGSGAIIVQADDVDGFASALELLLADDDLRHTMGQSAYRLTVPRFTWPNMTTAFLQQIDVHTESGSGQ